MRSLRFPLLALLGAVALVVGSLLPAAAAPCDKGPAMSCDVCLGGILFGAPACAAAGQAVAATGPAALSARHASRAWFGAPVVRPYGFDRRPDLPPPRRDLRLFASSGPQQWRST
jgi:hypothetical protein